VNGTRIQDFFIEVVKIGSFTDFLLRKIDRIGVYITSFSFRSREPDNSHGWERTLAMQVFNSNKYAAITAGLLTLLTGFLLFQFALHAGALWRDESNTIALATLPAFADVWAHLQFDSFPLLWLVIIRSLAFIGLATDGVFRTVGFLVGCALVSALWFNARIFRYHWPVLSLVLLGLSPSVLIWGSSLRAYGLGMVEVLLIFSLAWNYAEKGTGKAWGACLVATLAGVHTLYYNSVIVFACLLGGGVVLASHGKWRRAALLLLIGVITSLTLLPYLATFSGASDWNVLVRYPNYNPALFRAKINETLSPAGHAITGVWVALLVAALLIPVILLLFPRIKLTGEERDRVLYPGVVLAISIPSYYFFLHSLSYLTRPWYYLALVTLAAVSIDTVFGVISRYTIVQTGRIGAALLLVVFTTTTVYTQVRARMTNVDLIANALNRTATNNDLIIVNPWYAGVTFDRYYHGAAKWNTLPPLEDHRFHRYDLVKMQMITQNQTEVVAPVNASIRETLMRDGKVYLVGGLHFLKNGEPPQVLPPAPHPKWGWLDGPYYDAWSTQVAAFIQQHAKNARAIKAPAGQPVADYENLQLFVVEGWRD